MADGGEIDYKGGQEIPGMTATVMAQAKQAVAGSSLAPASPYSAAAAAGTPMPSDIPQPAQPEPEQTAAAEPPAPDTPSTGSPATGQDTPASPPAQTNANGDAVGADGLTDAQRQNQQQKQEPSLADMIPEQYREMFTLIVAFIAALQGNGGQTPDGIQPGQITDVQIADTAGKIYNNSDILVAAAGEGGVQKVSARTPQRGDILITKSPEGDRDIAAVVLGVSEGKIHIAAGEKGEATFVEANDPRITGVIATKDLDLTKVATELQRRAGQAPEVAQGVAPDNLGEARAEQAQVRETVAAQVERAINGIPYADAGVEDAHSSPPPSTPGGAPGRGGALRVGG